MTIRIGLVLAIVCGASLAFAQDPAPEDLDPLRPQQVSVAVKIVEFQAEKAVETGLSAYFARRNKARMYNRLTSGNGAITTADLTFPMSPETAAITVFLDRIRMSEGDLEFVLEALASESRAYILSRPRALVMVGQATQTTIKTVQNNPYENPVVVGTTIVDTTAFKDTGVSLSVKVPDLADDDKDWFTQEDSYVKLELEASITELGNEVLISTNQGGVAAPQFSNRLLTTTVWVRHGQTLILGGLYRNTKQKNLASVPWLAQGEDLVVGLAENVVPGQVLGSPLSNMIGNRASEQTRRELVFFIRTETWLPSFTVAEEHAFIDFEEGEDWKRPTDVIKEKVRSAVEGTKGAVENASGASLGSELGAEIKGEGL
ncbi:MAG: hypothetical protein GY851_27820 [bacterium]|nr:hypothetical protein [bacterium]